MLTARQIEAFHAIMQVQTVTKAAEALFISQPAVSRLITDLEHEVGFALFDRVRGRLIPTDDARALHEEVERSFQGLSRIAGVARDIKTARKGLLQIAAAPSLSMSFLPTAISGFLEQHPEVQISLAGSNSSTVVDMVSAQRCHLGFVLLPTFFPGAHAEKLLTTEVVCILPPGHHLASKSVLRPPDLADAKFVSHPSDMESRLRIDTLFAAFGVKRHLQIETQFSGSVCAFVENGLGLALIDPITALNYPGRIAIRRFEPALYDEAQVMFPAQRPPAQIARKFIDHVRRLALTQLGTIT